MNPQTIINLILSYMDVCMDVGLLYVFTVCMHVWLDVKYHSKTVIGFCGCVFQGHLEYFFSAMDT